MTNEEKINLIGQKMLILSNDLDKSKNELNALKLQLEALQKPTAASTIKSVTPTLTPATTTITTPQPTPIAQPEIKHEIPKIKIEEPIQPPHQRFNIPLNKE